MAFAEDLSPFFATAGFAITASRTPAGGGSAQPGSAIMDEPGVVLDEGVVSDSPSALIAATQWVSVAQGDTITVSSGDLTPALAHLAGTYKVRQIMPEDDGATRRLILARTS